MFDMLRIYQPTVTETCICQFYIYQVYRIALQVGRKIAPCDRALIHVCLAYLFLHSGQVLSSFKCYFKRKYLNLIDSNCDVDECCPWFFIGTVLACHRPLMYYQYICDIGEEKSLWDGCSSIVLRVAICCVGLAARILVTGAWFCAHGKQ